MPIPTEYYEKKMRTMEDLTNQSSQRTLSFWQHILLVSSSIDGILISLHAGQSEHIYTQLAFLLSTVVLSLGILTTSIVVYDYSMLLERTRQKFADEFQNALREGREMRNVVVDTRKRTKFFENFSLISLICAILFMLLYTILKELF